jgi:DNA-binding ferritin-like protein (Dps family)
MTDIELNNFLNIFYKLKIDSKDPRYGFNDNWNTFIKKVLALSPKSYGTKIQNRIMEKNNLQSVKANEDKGDFKINNKYFEVKCSLITVTNTTANITGIRPWQNIDGYYIFIIDAKDYKNITTYSFKLSRVEMKKEQEVLNFCPINGTKKANEGNTNSALRFGFSLESESFKRWCKDYLFEQDDIVKEL